MTQEPRTPTGIQYQPAFTQHFGEPDLAARIEAEAREQGEVSREPELRALMSELTGERALADRLAAALSGMVAVHGRDGETGAEAVASLAAYRACAAEATGQETT